MKLLYLNFNTTQTGIPRIHNYTESVIGVLIHQLVYSFQLFGILLKHLKLLQKEQISNEIKINQYIPSGYYVYNVR